MTPESRTWNFSIMLHSLCSLYNAVLIQKCHQRTKTLNHDSVTIFSLKIYEELCLFKDSPKKISSTQVSRVVNNTQIYIIHEKTQISVKSQTFGSTLQREKHQHLNIVGCLTNKENSSNRMLYLCHKIQFKEPDIVNF